MGIMIAYLYPTDDLTGGTPAPESMTDPATTTPPPRRTTTETFRESEAPRSYPGNSDF
jgi:hypothetical protein